MRHSSPPPSALTRLALRLALVVVGLLALATGVLLPFAVHSALENLAAPPSPRLYRLGPPQQPAPQHLRIHLIVAALDVVEQTASITVTAYQVCPAACTDAFELQLISAFSEGPHDEGVPPSASVSLPAQPTEVAAAAYAVFIQPVDQLVINVSALLLGIWGVRSILVIPGGPPITAVDLSLSLVMLFLLAAIAVRTLAFLYVRSGLSPPRRR